MNFNTFMQLTLLLCLSIATLGRGMHHIEVTQSIVHILYNPKSLSVAQRFIEKDERMAMFNTLVAKEKELQDDYYTFVHGQRAEYYFPEKLYTHLWQMRKMKAVSDFMFLHAVPVIEIDEERLIEEYEHERLLKYGRTGLFDYAGRKKLLFMNYAFFANSGLTGSSSSYFVAKNHNHIGYSLQAADVCKLLNYEWIYERFKEEINELELLYKEKSSYGNIMLVAFPKATIADLVYPAHPGGRKKEVYIAGAGYTSDMQLIMETIRNAPEKIHESDSLEFCLIMTQKNGGLDPCIGIKIFPILSGMPSVLRLIEQKEQGLFVKITKAVDQQERQQAALRRANTLVNHLVLPPQERSALETNNALGRISAILGHLCPKSGWGSWNPFK